MNFVDRTLLEAPDAAAVRLDPQPHRPSTLSWALGVAFVILLCARIPNLIWPGRFYAEEGQFFFAYAWHMPWSSALSHVFGGYLNIVVNAATLLDARLVAAGGLSLENAPYFTESVGLAFQICPAILLLTSRAEWLAPIWAAPAALLIVAASPMTEEIWLQTLHVQFHLGLCAAIILMTSAENGRISKFFRFVLLALGPLCGPPAILLLPFFVARTIFERSTARVAQTAALGLGAAVQLIFFFQMIDRSAQHVGLDLLACLLFSRHFVLPFLGASAEQPFFLRAFGGFSAGNAPWDLILLSLGTILAIVVVALRRWREDAAWMAVIGLSVAAASYLGGLPGGPNFLFAAIGERYNFIPHALFGFALIALAAKTQRTNIGKLSLAALALLCVQDLVTFRATRDVIADGPNWRDEVAQWRADPQHRMSIYPSTDWWSVNLSPNGALCSNDPKDANSPDYCDQFWVNRMAEARRASAPAVVPAQ